MLVTISLCTVDRLSPELSRVLNSNCLKSLLKILLTHWKDRKLLVLTSREEKTLLKCLMKIPTLTIKMIRQRLIKVHLMTTGKLFRTLTVMVCAIIPTTILADLQSSQRTTGVECSQVEASVKSRKFRLQEMILLV